MAFKNKKLFRRLKKPYRLSIVNENTLEEKASFLLTPLNILLFTSSFLLLFFFITYSIFNYSNITKYLPGKKVGSNQAEMIEMQKKLDEIENQHRVEIKRQKDLISVLSGNTKSLDTIDAADFNADIEIEQTVNPIIKPGVNNNQGVIYVQNDLDFENILLFTPIIGKISKGFDANNHKAVDITPVVKDASVKATLEGTVIFTGWTPDFGHVISIQHIGNLVSVYKHNSYLHKKIGDFVRAGEVIAVAGNTGELSDGTHLHFELWYNGRALDPTSYISF